MDRGDSLLYAETDIARVRAWCLSLGLDQAAAALRRLAPQASGRGGSRPSGGVRTLLEEIRVMERSYAGSPAGAALCRTRELIEDDRWP